MQDDKCMCDGHKSNSISGFCLEANCKLSSYCVKCVKTHHKDHLDSCLEYNNIIKLLKEICLQQEENQKQLFQIKLLMREIYRTIQKKMRTQDEKNKLEQKNKALFKNISKVKDIVGRNLTVLKELLHNAEQNYYQYLFEKIELIKIYKNKSPQIILGELIQKVNSLFAAMKKEIEKHDDYLRILLVTSVFENVFEQMNSVKGQALPEKKLIEELIDYYDQFIKINPSCHKNYFNKGKKLNVMGRYEDAIQCLDKSIQINLSYYKAYNEKGKALNGLRRYKEAILCLDQSIQICPGFYKAYNNKGMALNGLKRYDEAIQCLNQSIQINSRYYKTYNCKGDVLIQMEQCGEAIANYEQSIEINSKQIIAYNNKKYALDLMEILKKAKDNTSHLSFIKFDDQSELSQEMIFLKKYGNQQQQEKQKEICPYPKRLNFKQMPQVDEHFLISPALKGGMIQCMIIRDKSGMCIFNPIFHMHICDGLQYLMSAKKQKGQYIISKQKDNLEQGNNILGKVESNFRGTEFNLYDSGEKKTQNPQQQRKQLGIVQYQNKILDKKGYREMMVLLPNLNDRDQLYEFKPSNSNDGILHRYLNNNREQIVTYVSIPSQWDDQKKKNVQDFYERIKIDSVKNFQLIENQKKDNIVLQFGRVEKDKFNLDFQYPITPLQAFQIALTTFDYNNVLV